MAPTKVFTSIFWMFLFLQLQNFKKFLIRGGKMNSCDFLNVSFQKVVPSFNDSEEESFTSSKWRVERGKICLCSGSHEGSENHHVAHVWLKKRNILILFSEINS